MPRRRQEDPSPEAGDARPEGGNARRETLVRPKERERTQTIFDYMKYFDRVVEANGWDDIEAGRVFAAMIGPADRTLDSLEERWETFSELKGLILEKQKPLREAKLTELINLKIKEGEQIEDLKSRTLRLVAETYPDFPQNIQFQIARDHFLHALRDEIRMQVLVAKPVTLDDTVNIALSCTLLLEKEKFSICPITSTYEQTNKPNFQKNFGTDNRKFKSSDNRGPRNFRCFKCQGFGHVQRFCPSKFDRKPIAFVNEEMQSENSSLLRDMGQSQ